MAEDIVHDFKEYLENLRIWWLEHRNKHRELTICACIPSIKLSPVLKAFLAGSISGTCSTVLFQPLDLVKTRLQSSTHVAALSRINGPAGMMEVLNNIIQKEHLFALWKGMVPSLTRCVPGVGLYFGSMHWMKSTFTDGRPTAVQAMSIGVAARTISGVCLIPITVVKTRVESGEYKYRGVVDALRHIYRAEGVRGLSCGLIPTLVRDAPFSGLYLVFYSQIKQALPRDVLIGEQAAATHFTVGLLAGVLASLVTQPADVIKTKMQLYPGQYKNLLHVMVFVHQKYGLRGYFKGLVPRMLRRTLIAAMAWTIYEQLTQSIGLK